MSTATHPSRHGAHAATSPEVEAPPVDEDELAMEIAAAQLRLVTDRRLGKVTPDWVKALAAEQPRSHAS
jgi:hypothetical protein